LSYGDARLERVIVKLGLRETEQAEDAAPGNLACGAVSDASDEALAEPLAAGGCLPDLLVDLDEAVAQVAEDALDELADRGDSLAHRGPAEGGGERGGAADDQVQRGFSPAGFVLERGAEPLDGGCGGLE